MPDYNITFTETPGSYGTLIEYKKEGDLTWTTPTSPANPTTLETYPLTLDPGFKYYVRLSSVGLNCTTKYVIIPIEDNICCPDGYTLSPDESYCYIVETVAATPPSGGTPETSVPKSFSQYSKYGTVIYSPGYNIDGTGANTRITPLSTLLWANPSLNTTDGPLNRTGLWGTTETANQLVGFSYCFDLTESKVYYIGAGADNAVLIRLDGVDIVDMDEAAITSYLYTEYSIVDVSYMAPYTFWHIYPVTIPAGPHILEVIGRNGSVVGINPGTIGIEIYDNTPSELMAATNIADLDIIFSTESIRSGAPLQIGSDGVGYTCPDGYSLDSCEEPYTCKRLLTTPTTTC
jgi:hypothetical protein